MVFAISPSIPRGHAALHIPQIYGDLDQRIQKAVENHASLKSLKKIFSFRQAILDSLPHMDENCVNVIASYLQTVEDPNFPHLSQTLFNGEVVYDKPHLIGIRNENMIAYDYDSQKPIWLLSVKGIKWRFTGKGIVLFDQQKIQMVNGATGEITEITAPFPVFDLQMTGSGFCCLKSWKNELVRGKIKEGKFIQEGELEKLSYGYSLLLIGKRIALLKKPMMPDSLNQPARFYDDRGNVVYKEGCNDARYWNNKIYLLREARYLSIYNEADFSLIKRVDLGFPEKEYSK